MKCNAYFTIEASLLTPMTFLILLWIIYLGFFQYNRCLLTQDSYIMAMTESRKCYQSNTKMYQNIIHTGSEWDWGKYISFQSDGIEAVVGKGKVQIRAGGSLRTPFRFPFLKNEVWNIRIERQSVIINPVAVMRNYKILENKSNRKEEENAKGNY